MDNRILSLETTSPTLDLLSPTPHAFVHLLAEQWDSDPCSPIAKEESRRLSVLRYSSSGDTVIATLLVIEQTNG